MASPFAGMDPFIEAQQWEDFHASLIPTVKEALVPSVRPRYVVQVEERVYLQHPIEGSAGYIEPDVLVAERPSGGHPNVRATGGGAVIARTVELLTLPMPDRRRELFLTLRDRQSREVVTVIEVLSPTNKRAGSDG